MFGLFRKRDDDERAVLVEPWPRIPVAPWAGGGATVEAAALAMPSKRRPSVPGVVFTVPEGRAAVRLDEVHRFLDDETVVLETTHGPTIYAVWTQAWPKKSGTAVGDMLEGEAPGGLAFLAAAVEAPPTVVLRDAELASFRAWVAALPS
ncbi:hypothetical protein [Frigoribacterium sp. Leaf172]|uniref:hypothetical protein n=1 Tax=Frigoribacterium sp. Leaf172 TaxID=1736285 RepID=UPI0006F3421D|nr:hypothetical protein [Frigoribacterium sp. Leaf172]KQR66209.1 hypothetical protein ASF89_03470 [Frigoribacterium sp. Leaf172]